MDNNDPEENLFDAGLGIVVGVLLLLVIALPLPDRDKPFQNCHAPNDGVTRNMRGESMDAAGPGSRVGVGNGLESFNNLIIGIKSVLSLIKLSLSFFISS